MAGYASFPDRSRSSFLGDFDEQLWPINILILVLAGALAGIVAGHGDFTATTWYLNANTHLGIIGGAVVLMMIGFYLLKGRTRRRLQLCVLLSLLLHLSAGYGAWLNPMKLDVAEQRKPDEDMIDDLVAPDYYWAQAEEAPVEEAFEVPVEAAVQEQTTTVATVEPRDMGRPAPAADIPRAPSAEETPLGSSSGPGKPVEIAMAPAAVAREVNPVETLAMSRQAVNSTELPEIEAQQPTLPAGERPKARDLQPGELAAAKGSKDPDAAGPDPRTLGGSARKTGGPGDDQLAMNITAPLAAGGGLRGKTSEGPGLKDVAANLPEAKLDRKDGGALPPDAAAKIESPQSTAPAGGGAPEINIEASRASGIDRNAAGNPGGKVASTDPGTGNNLPQSRSGVPMGQGRNRPGPLGLEGEGNDLVRAGDPRSALESGLPLALQGGRNRALATEGSGAPGPNAGLNPQLQKTDSGAAVNLPADMPTINQPDAVAAIGPGNGTGRGGSLEAGRGAVVAARPVDSAFGVRGTSRRGVPGWGAEDESTGPVSGGLSGGGQGPAGLAPGLVPGPRRTEAAVGPSTSSGGQLTRTDGGMDLPASVIELSGPQPIVSTAARTRSAPAIESSVGRGGSGGMGVGPVADRRGVGGRRLGSVPGSGEEDLLALRGGPSLTAPQTADRAPRRPGSGVEPSDLASISGPPGLSGGGSRGTWLPEGTVVEPTAAYRHRGDGVPGGGGAGAGGFTEPAIEDGLRFFAKLQFPDGRWSLHKLPDGVNLDSPGLAEEDGARSDSAATGLVMLSYLGAGYNHLQHKYRSTLRRGVTWLARQQKPDGDLSGDCSKYAQLYSHGIAAMALCEVYGMTQDPELREPARKAVAFIVAAQDPERGGWRYYPGQANNSDTSVTGWQIMALKSAQMAGLDVPQETFRKAEGWLDRARVPERNGQYVYNPWNPEQQMHGRMPSPTMTAEAMLMRMYMGQRRDNSQLIRGAEYILENLPEMGQGDQWHRNCYYWYYATQAMYQMQGDYWKKWNARISPLLKSTQVMDGPLAGSWDPIRPASDRWGAYAGRVYVTAMHLLMLEVNYRHLPLFQELSK